MAPHFHYLNEVFLTEESVAWPKAFHNGGCAMRCHTAYLGKFSDVALLDINVKGLWDTVLEQSPEHNTRWENRASKGKDTLLVNVLGGG